MAGDFEERMRYLGEQVGDGKIVARCTVNQPYAQIQHQKLDYDHSTTEYGPPGGSAFYLGGPLMENQEQLMFKIARKAITEEGSDIEGAMIDVAQDMADYVAKNAPIETGRLRQSASPSVESNGITIFYIPPKAPREHE